MKERVGHSSIAGMGKRRWRGHKQGGHNRRPPPLGLALEVSQERQELTFSERGVVGTSLLPPDLSLTAKVKPVLGRRERLNRQTLESFHR